jgi:anti-sigma factor RsiW
MGHEEYKEMLELAALDALDEERADFLQQHLETCAECGAELAELRDTAASLIYLTPPAQAPAELRARVLEAIKLPGTSSSLEGSAADGDADVVRNVDKLS